MPRSRFTVLLVIGSLFLFVGLIGAFGQSRPQRPETPQGEGKRNKRPVPKTEEELKKEAEEKARLEAEKNAEVDPTVEKIESNIVNVDAVVYNKKTGQIITGLKKENFTVFEDGVKQNISNFATPEAPITVTLVVEYSKWTEVFGSAQSGGWEPGTYEVIRPVASFLTKFIKPPKKDAQGNVQMPPPPSDPACAGEPGEACARRGAPAFTIAATPRRARSGPTSAGSDVEASKKRTVARRLHASSEMSKSASSVVASPHSAGTGGAARSCPGAPDGS